MDKSLQNRAHTKRYIYTAIFVVVVVVWWFSIPAPLFDVPHSTVITDKESKLLGAHIAKDEQWRFPAVDSVPYKFATSITLFEDEYFRYHPGVNPFSLFRALKQNIKAGRVVSGGSTITLQVIRLSLLHKRTVWSKMVEIFQATRLEATYSKNEILELYASNAPFGGNIVGLNAASWQYFGRPPHELSWAEAAVLAVLPNSPALIHPGKNRNLLLAKRDRLLKKLLTKSRIDSSEYTLALAEPLPSIARGLPSGTPGITMPMPRLAPHLLTRLIKKKAGVIYNTTLDKELQENVNSVIEHFNALYRQNKINNIAALIIETSSGKVRAYVGNARDKNRSFQNDVDIVTAPRSTGSILKPFLYGTALNEGLLLPHSLIPDIPTYYSDFSPKNYNKRYDGAVPADKALSRSLNVPAVRLLEEYGTEKFMSLLQELQLSTITRSSSNYGLSLILGGAEATLWDLAGAYASLARSLKYYNHNNSTYDTKAIYKPLLLKNETPIVNVQEHPILSPASIYYVFSALTNVERPDTETGWKTFATSRKVAWKTGTSFGFRDAWAIGVTPGYVVAVWVGNATGEGRPGIIGGYAAAPVMFELFRLLPSTGWFDTPYDDMEPAVVCRKSGFIASQYCDETDTLYLPITGNPKPTCEYHKLIHLSADEKYRVNSDCYPVTSMKHKSWFVLPPVMEWYYKSVNPSYTKLPPLLPGCNVKDDKPMSIIYPKSNTKVFIPVDIDGKLGRLVVKATHRSPNAIVYWYLDDNYIGETKEIHQMEILPDEGWHTITLTNGTGNRFVRRFYCVGRGGDK